MKNNNFVNKLNSRRNQRRRRINRRRMRGNRRIINRNRRYVNNFRNLYRRVNNNTNNINTANKPKNQSNQLNKKTNDKIDKLTKDISKLSLSLFPKTTNIYRKMKEPRIDKVVTPMEMGLSHQFTSIFKTGNRIRYMSLYNRFEMTNSNTGNTKMLWFPYCVNFQSYPDLSITVSDGNEGSIQPNVINPIVRIVTNRLTDVAEVLTVYNCASCGLIGNYRIVGASMKITNLSPFNTKAGSYIIYKLNENTTYPPFYNSVTPPNLTNSPDYAALLTSLVNLNHDQVMLKQSFSASDVGYIHEYNVYEGNNIFQTPNEYIGVDYISGVEPVALWSGNPQGNNIKYQIDIQTTSTTQSYLIECWQIIEIVPDPSLNLDNITDFQTHVFNDEVLDEIRRKMPIVKG